MKSAKIALQAGRCFTSLKGKLAFAAGTLQLKASWTTGGGRGTEDTMD